MKKPIQIILAVLLLAALFASGCASSSSALPEAEKAEKGLAQLADCKPGALLSEGSKLHAGDSVGDWTAIMLAEGGVKEDYKAYLSSLEKYVTDCYAARGCLDSMKATEYHRVILTVLALGGDPTAFGTDAAGQPVNLVADGIWNFPDLRRQGLNGLVFALISLDAGGYEPPPDSAVTRESLVFEILASQEADGGFGLTAGSSEADITAMALQALAPYKESCMEAVDAGLAYLAGQMTDRSTFVTFGDESSESAAQIIIALCTLGIDPDTDGRFIRGGMTLTEGLEVFYRDGCYSHTPDGKADVTATSQAVLALIAIHRLREGGLPVYQFKENTSTAAYLPVSGAAAACGL